MKKIFLLIALSIFITSMQAQLKLPNFFSDHMVLQRNKPVSVWGWGDKGSVVTIEINGSIVNTSVGEDGKWFAYVPPMKAGGPFALKITEPNSDPIIYNDVMIGDVWFASGQSNMEWQVQQADGADKEIPNALNNNIRLCQIPHAVSLKPLDNTLEANWKICDSTSVKEFSAVAYYFAKNIQPEIGVAVGLIQSSWGGTPVEAWTSTDMLQSMAFGRKLVAKADTITYADLQKDTVDLDTFWDIVYNPSNKIDSIIANPAYDDSDWREVAIPGVIKDWESDFYEGMIWLRKKVELKKAYAEKDLTINLGHPEMNYSLYFNGAQICKNQWNANLKHTYTIPASLVKKGDNVIAIRVAALWGGGGLNAPGDDIYLTNDKKKISLVGNWMFKKDIEQRIPKIQYYQTYASFLNNAMINPVQPYSLKGCLWYQGENNEGEAYMYRKMLPLMINDWRIKWKQGNLPFVLVQLPNYMKVDKEPTDGKWAVLRESQTEALNLPNTYLTCIIDCGTGENIHPTNKTVVGERLAKVVVDNVYGKDIVSSGPVMDSFSIDGNRVIVDYKLADGLKIKGEGELKGFAIAGEDQQFYWANATIKGNQVVLTSDQVSNPVAVRYAWGNNPICNLVNSVDLPALPFRTDNWKVITQPK
nr:sialate O-acetylesterase [uncultured Carboxylicivirga sp.]